MANSRTFVEHALDLVGSLGPVQARAMFGGHGLYLRGVMFGLLDDDELFLKTDDETRPRFLAAECRMWVYPGMTATRYYRPPDAAHEDSEAMRPWARLAVDAALRAKARKDAKARAAAARRGARATEEPPPARRRGPGGAKKRDGAARPPRARGRRAR
jgi:DNA transformation protein